MNRGIVLIGERKQRWRASLCVPGQHSESDLKNAGNLRGEPGACRGTIAGDLFQHIDFQEVAAHGQSILARFLFRRYSFSKISWMSEMVGDDSS